MWDGIIKNILKKDPEEKPEIHRMNRISYVESYPQNKIQKQSYKENVKTKTNVSPSISNRILSCPVCKIPMETKILSLSGVEIDECPQCKGIFLDKGELQEIIGYDLDIQRKKENTWIIYTPHGKEKKIYNS